MLTEYMKPNQLVAINKEVIVNMIIFFDVHVIKSFNMSFLVKLDDYCFGEI